MQTVTQYQSVLATLGRPTPSWVKDKRDGARVAAYDAYDDMYASAPNTFTTALRGTNDNPIYIPTTRRLVEAINRYFAKGWKWTIKSATTNASDVTDSTSWLESTYLRNRFESKLLSYKRNMIKRGDAVFHVMADLSRTAGTRIRIMELSPRTYFKIEDLTDPEKLLGAYVVTTITTVLANGSNVDMAQRLAYRYVKVGDGTRITVQLAFFEPGAWDDRFPGLPPLRPVAPPAEFKDDPLLREQMLPASVTTIPLYHAVNNRQDEEVWGTSEVAGLESVIAGIVQGASDEDITLALQGLGFYVTTSTRPINSDGEETDWIVGPGIVAEIKPGTTMERVAGLDKVTPFLDHIDMLKASVDEAAGITATAVGTVDSQLVASGVALRLDMAPILSKNAEKEVELRGVLDQMGMDLLDMWGPVDGQTFAKDLVVQTTFDDPLPVDRAGIIKEITDLVAKGLMSRKFAIEQLSKRLGYEFPPNMLDDINADVDAESARLASELGASDNAIGVGPPVDPNAPQPRSANPSPPSGGSPFAPRHAAPAGAPTTGVAP